MNEKDKRFLVFGYDTYYPNGGMTDLLGSFDTISEAIIFIKKGTPFINYKRETEYYCSEYYDLYDRIKGVRINTEYYENL